MRNINGLKKNSEFQKVYGKRRSVSNNLLIIYTAPNKLDISRIGISVSKKVGNSIVRHRVSRLVREAYRLNKDELIGGYDFIVVARPAACESNFFEIQDAYLKLLKKAGMLIKRDVHEGDSIE